MQKDTKKGYFIVSLDFELFWGMFDKVTLETYGDRIRGERTAIPRMLDIFSRYGIHATWATVGMLMAKDKQDLLTLLPSPELQPVYEDMRMSSYEYLKTAPIETDTVPDIYHFGSDLVWKILATPFQEIGNHTFSHFYCIDGYTNRPEVFRTDLEAFERALRPYETTTESIDFPRNQASVEALRICAEKGIRAYRGNEAHVLYTPRKNADQSLLIRAFRLLDHYINLSGYHTYPLPKAHTGIPLDIPSSRFFRPWNRMFSIFEPLRLRRIMSAMTHAAKNGEVFHLWWHPHNFGIDQKQNFKNLETILRHFKKLQEQYNMESASMSDITKCVDEQVASSI